METLNSQNILPIINGEDLTRSRTQIFKQTIDNPRDHDLKRRQTLWSFQQKNRGVRGKFRGVESNSHSDCESCEDLSLLADDTKAKNNKRTFFPKLKAKLKPEATVSPGSDGGNCVKREYSSALRIGNKIYEQLIAKQNIEDKSDVPNQKQLPKSPDLSASLSKLSYLKATRNVVFHGGGFFGRNGFTDNRYGEFHRSWTTLSPSESRKVHNHHQNDPKYYGSMKNLCGEYDLMTDSFATERLENHSPKIASKVINERKMFSKRKIDAETENVPKKSKEELIKLEMLSERYSINFDKSSAEEDRGKSRVSLRSEESMRRNKEWQKQIDIIVARRDREGRTRTNGQKDVDKKDNSTRNSKLKENKTKATNTEALENATDRPKSDMSLDIPKEQFGPSSYKPEEANNRLLNPAYCINPYKWTSRNVLTGNDRNWVEKALEKTEIIDTTIYDGFAHKRQKSIIRNGENAVKDKSRPP